MKYDAITERYLAQINKGLKSVLIHEDIPSELSDSMIYSAMAGGKRLRPIMLLATAHMFGGEEAVQKSLPLALGVELIHTYSLIHDDLPAMDNDSLRRGKPTNHTVFGEGVAILAGDGLLTYAFEIMLEALLENFSESYARAILIIANGSGVSGMVAGQLSDIQNERNPLSGFEQLKTTHALKTGALLRGCACAGALAGGADLRMQKEIMQFGDQFGLLFQITDDILDVTGSSDKLGKSTGKDESQGKLTYVSLFGLDGARARAKEATSAALETLRVFGDSAWYLRELTQRTAQREK